MAFPHSLAVGHRDLRSLNFVRDLVRDLGYAGRAFRRSPGFAAFAVLVMALGIGANTAVFSVVNGVLLKPLPYPGADRIVTLSTAELALGRNNPLVTIANYRDWRDQSSSFEAMATYRGGELPVSPGATAEYGQASIVDDDFFRIFAVQPLIGRTFAAEEVAPGSDQPAALISHEYWQSRYGGDPRVLERTLRVDTEPWPIVGVMPPGFDFPRGVDIWLSERTTSTSRTAHNRFAVGRLKPDVSLEQAQTELTAIAAGLAQQYPESNEGRGVVAARLHDQIVGAVRPTLYLLWGVVGVVLLIACANTATLLLGKATARTREVAVRAALGASRRRIIRQLIAESLLLALVAGTSGMVLAYWATKALVALTPADVVRFAETGIDGSVLAFTLAVSLATSLLFGLVPALHASRVDLTETIKEGATRSVTDRRMVSTRGMLVVAEIALAVVLLTAAGLLVKSLVALRNVELGFQPENVLVMKATGMSSSLRENNVFFRDVLSRIAAVPGVVAVGAMSSPPGDLSNSGSGTYFIDRIPETRDRANDPFTYFSIVAPGTFAALGIPLKSGRDFDESDIVDAPMVAIVNEALVQRSLGGGENPIGRTIYCNFDVDAPMTIVGVVGDVRQRGPGDEPVADCYMPYRQHSYNTSTLYVVARTAGDPAALAPTLRRVTADVSPTVPVSFTTMEAIVSERVEDPRFRALLLAAFAGLAVCLAMAGVYGVMAYSVEQRSNEIGLRMALGASKNSVLRLILGQGLVLAVVGLALGLMASVAATRLLTTMLFEVQPVDAQVYLGVAMLLGAVTLVAGYLPARRAAVLDPVEVIRNEPGSMWHAARRKVRRAVRELSAGREPSVVPVGTLIGEFADSVRRAASFPEVKRATLETFRERLGAQSAVLLEEASGEEYRSETCSLPAQGVLLNRLRRYPHPLALTRGHFEKWVRWAREFKPEHSAEIERLQNTGARMAIPLRTLDKSEILGVLLLGPPDGRESYTTAEKQLLSSSSEVFALMIENAHLTDRTLEQEKLRRDLALAAEVQRRLLPQKPPPTTAVALAAFSLPARTVGGDYYDFLDLGDERIGIAVADVSGKGIAAALLMSVVQASLRVILAEKDVPVSRLVAKMNGFLYRSTEASKYATFFYAQIEERGRRLRYVNAGHNPPYLIRRSQTGVEVTELSIGGTVLGLFPEVHYEEADIDLCPGDLLVAFTDGVTEALNPGGEEFGEERLKDLLRRTVGAPEEISSMLTDRMQEWIGGAEQHDDLTFVIVAVS